VSGFRGHNHTRVVCDYVREILIRFVEQLSFGPSQNLANDGVSSDAWAEIPDRTAATDPKRRRLRASKSVVEVEVTQRGIRWRSAMQACSSTPEHMNDTGSFLSANEVRTQVALCGLSSSLRTPGERRR